MSEVLCLYEDDKYALRIVRDDYPENPREWDSLTTMAYGHKKYKLGDKEADNTDLYNSWEEWLKGEVLNKYGKHNVVYLSLFLYDHSGISINTTGFNCKWDSGQVGYIYTTKELLIKETGYTEQELFNTDKNRTPEIGERVRIAKFGNDWGQVVDTFVQARQKVYKVDFDYYKIPDAKNVDRCVLIKKEDITEVMAGYAYEILKGDVETYNCYLKGDVFGFVLEEVIECASCGDTEYDEIDSCYGFYGYSLEEIKRELRGSIPQDAEYLIDKLERV